MSKKRIFTVGFDLPGNDFEYIELESDQTLLDADIILFEPTLPYTVSGRGHGGKTLLDGKESFRTEEILGHWRTEIVAACKAGKLIIVYLIKPIELFREVYDSSGFPSVVPVSSYESVPQLKLNGIVARSGEKVRLVSKATYIKPYWEGFSEYSPYQATITGEFTDVLLRTHSGDRVVGAAFRPGSGAIVFLPPLRGDAVESDGYDEEYEALRWTQESLEFGARLATTLSCLFDVLNKSAQRTPPPAWVLGSEYRLAMENELEKQIAGLSSKIAKLQEKKSGLASALLDAGGLRSLLFEQGKPLEQVLLEALQLFGFEAQQVADGDSEFDVVLSSSEGRCLGEAEGRDNKAINVGKHSQLERNLQEDFARDDVDGYAKGVLFGNAHRLMPVAERAECFTKKCISAAQRAKTALVRTPDMFGPAKYLKEHPEDEEYATQCRTAIFSTEGEIAVFPSPPMQEGDSLTESTPNE